MANHVFEKISSLAQSAIHRIRVRSALNPILWLCAVATPVCLFAAFQFQENQTLCSCLVVAGLAPIAVACLGFIGFALFNPDKLQSEDYQIRHEALQILQQKSGQIAIDPTSLEAIANPTLGLLGEGGEDE